MSAGAKVLLIEDDSGISDTLQRVLAGEGHDVAVERRGDDGLARAARETFNLVITDLRLPGLSGLELVRQLHEAQPRLPIILTTAFGTTETAIEATKFGAYDYLLKPFDIPHLIDLVQKAANSNRLMSEPVSLGEDGSRHDALIGQSAPMQSIYKEIGRIASKPVNVLIRGETGSGKELIARAIYQHGDRANASFIAVNCAAIPETLLESELFGHEKGAFTGAISRRIGRFEQAHQGTIFLDEIGDMTPGTQAKLLRVLEEKCLQRLGGKEDIALDVRVIAATHRDLESAIRQKEFREDLYYRLNVVSIRLPPLRQRREDIPDLVRYFLRKHGPSLGNVEPSIHADAIELLRSQSWPGNVRELENAVRKALLLAQNYTLGAEHFRGALARNEEQSASPAQPLGDYVDGLLAAARRGEAADIHARVIETAERELFGRAIREAQGNQAKAARWLGVTRVTMKAKLVQFGLHSSSDGEQP
ncbi:MAG TPA: sigma-54 dependent transcriptional regulator [Verrucomicrobiae bacterium]|jgi:DNA-binding NtrC family response regulator|nr:sigma-54 dependent transcriptional regulator [Verrucomicrobiae bacterium]